MANARELAASIADEGLRIVSGGTDTHMFLVDVISRGITGKQAQDGLESAGITVNKNAIPFDEHPPMVTSGIRIGSPALTTRGMKEPEMRQIGKWIGEVLKDIGNERMRSRIKARVQELGSQFPLYEWRLSPDRVGA